MNRLLAEVGGYVALGMAIGFFSSAMGIPLWLTLLIIGVVYLLGEILIE